MRGYAVAFRGLMLRRWTGVAARGPRQDARLRSGSPPTYRCFARSGQARDPGNADSRPVKAQCLVAGRPECRRRHGAAQRCRARRGRFAVRASHGRSASAARGTGPQCRAMGPNRDHAGGRCLPDGRQALCIDSTEWFVEAAPPHRRSRDPCSAAARSRWRELLPGLGGVRSGCLDGHGEAAPIPVESEHAPVVGRIHRDREHFDR
jgi:hypothetical protein